MKRCLSTLLAVVALCLAVVPAQTHAQSYQIPERRFFYTPGYEHIVVVQRTTIENKEPGDVTPNEAELMINEFNSWALGGFTSYHQLFDPPYPVRYTDHFIAFEGTSTFQWQGAPYRFHQAHLIISSVGSDTFFLLGLSPDATFYRYVNACDKLDKTRPAPHGYLEHFYPPPPRMQGGIVVLMSRRV